MNRVDEDHIKGDGPFDAIKIKTKKYIWSRRLKKLIRKGTQNEWVK